ncbi:hypothetical protein A2U01_0034228 [Trifolium medium]|uniref:Uncharacterized protein n=1 Tax=Trifolium medium TaxID=97028 RepID=A0A392PMR9_9FABA|nr:hypothetical protein [Trifolium medium]
MVMRSSTTENNHNQQFCPEPLARRGCILAGRARTGRTMGFHGLVMLACCIGMKRYGWVAWHGGGEEERKVCCCSASEREKEE